MTKQIEFPVCISGYESDDRTCNGYAKAKEEDDRAPCAFRDRCVAMILLVEKKRRADPEFGLENLVKLRVRNGEEFNATTQKIDGVLTKLISKHGVRDGKIGNPKGDPKAPKKAPKTRAATPSAEKAPKLASWFSDRVKEATGREIHPTSGDASPGELFVIDRMDKSNYAALYAKPATGNKRIAVASMYPNKRSGALQIRIATEFDSFVKMLSKTNRTRLAPADCAGSDGAFKVKILGLDKEGASIAAEVVGQAIEEGLIDIPEVAE